MKSASIEQQSAMSQQNPYKKLVKLKVLVKDDHEGAAAAQELADELDALRPKVRRDCLPGGKNEARPCPWYGCKWHLGLDINEDTGSMQVRSLDNMVHTCDLDVSEIGGIPGSGRGTGISRDEVGEIMELTHERIRTMEIMSEIMLKPLMKARGLAPDDVDRPAVIRRQKSSVVSDGAEQEPQEAAEIPLASEPDEP